MRYPTYLRLGSTKQRLAAVAGALLATVSIARAAPESAAYSVSQYNGSGECGCCIDISCSKLCSDSTWFTTFANTFDSKMAAMGFASSENWQNLAVDPEDIVDASRTTYGKDSVDPYGADHADVIFVSSHSNAKCDATNGWRSSFGLGQTHADQTCWPQTNSNILWGNSDADVAILFSCESIQKCVWSKNSYAGMSAGSFNMVMGFHGTMFLNSEANGRLSDFLSDTRNDDIGEYWVDYLTDIQGLPWEQSDVCATAVLWGSSDAAMDDMYDQGGFMDFWPTGAHTRTAFYYWTDCDPEHGEEL